MDINSLKQKIKTALQPSPFKITGVELESTAVTTLLTNFIGKDQFELTGACQKEETATQITVAGTTTQNILNSSNIQVTATFSVASNNAQITIRLDQMPDNWKLSDTLASLKGSLFDRFNYLSPQLILNSQDTPSLPENFPTSFGYPAYSDSLRSRLKRGLSFQGTLQLESGLEGITWLLNASRWEVRGAIDLVDNLPSACLQSHPPSSPVTLAGFQIPFSLNLASVLLESSEAGDPFVVTSCLQLEADIEKDLGDGSPALKIPVFVRAYSGQTNLLTIESSLASASNILFDQIPKLLDNTSLSGQIPAQFPALTNIQLESIHLALNPIKREYISASATVSYKNDQGWPVFGGLITFKGMGVTFTFVNGGGSVVETTVAAAAEVAGGTLEASLELPDMTFSCELAENQSIQIKELVKAVAGDSVTMPTIDCDEFKIFGDIKNSEYRFQANVTSDWTFSIGSKPFGLTQINMDLTHVTGPQSSTTGEIVGVFTVAGKQLFASASYQGSGSGWAFEGGTLGQQNISLTELISEVSYLFGVSLPDNSPTLILKNLNISFNTATHDCAFFCASSLSLLDVSFDIGVEVGLTHNTSGGTDKSFKGYLWIGNSQFEMDYLSTDQSKVLSATWSVDNDEKDYLGFGDIAKALGLDPPDIPSGLDLALKSASITYDLANKEFVLTAESVNYGKAVFAARKPESDWQFFFGLEIGKTINLSNLPLVGQELAKLQTIEIDKIQVIAASSLLDKDTAGTMDGLIPDGYPHVPADGMDFKAGLSMDFDFGGKKIPMNLDFGGDSAGPKTDETRVQTLPVPAGAPAPAASASVAGSGAPAPASGGGGTTWFNIQKTFGPVSLQRIGVKYQDQILRFLLDGSLALDGLKLQLQGLSIGVPLKDFKLPLKDFRPLFNLEGIGVDYANGPVEIGGGLLEIHPPPDFEFGGDVVIKTPEFSVAAAADYANPSGTPSFFIFGQVRGAFGGPPYFFVTGLAVGMGYNRSLRIPAQDEVLDFPLVAGLTDPAAIGGTNPTPLQALAALLGANGRPGWLEPRVGEMWLAAGVKFTSFELVNSNVLAVAEFGNEFALALIGLSTARFPQAGPTTYAYVELQIEAVFKPAEGYLGVTAALSRNSYVLDPACHLTGGFAFFLWFEGSGHEGDFVITAGGYSPYFRPPPWYPQEPRLGFNWPMDSRVSVTGEAYFALTPSAAMAGGALAVNFRDGNLRAWFTAHADMLISWKPFHFIAGVGVSVGASYRLNLLFTSKTVTAELGANLELWGPPTGGTVRVHWWVISFTVKFGAGRTENPGKLAWQDFKSLLPQPSDVVKIVATSGLAAAQKNPAGQVTKWFVRADDFHFTTSSAVPSCQLFAGPSATPFKQGYKLNIRPMQARDLISTHRVTLAKDGKPYDFTGWEIDALSRNVPKALWGGGSSGQLEQGGDQLVANQLAGLSFQAPKPKLVSGPEKINIEEDLSYDPLTPGVTPVQSGLPPSGPLPSADQNTIKILQQTMVAPEVKRQRDALYAALRGLGADPGTNGPLDVFVQKAGFVFEKEPMLVS